MHAVRSSAIAIAIKLQDTKIRFFCKISAFPGLSSPQLIWTARVHCPGGVHRVELELVDGEEVGGLVLDVCG